MADLINQWSTILVPILGLLAGTGWLQYYLNQRRSERDKRTGLVEDFLLPLQGILKTTKVVFDDLRGDSTLQRYEGNPRDLQRFFDALPNEDPRKHLWKSQIDLLQTENRRAIELVERFYGRIVTKNFRDECDRFLLHAKQWEVVWRTLAGTQTASTSLDSQNMLYSPQFPEGLEKALEDELNEVSGGSRE